MSSIAHEVAPVPEDQLDPTGRYVVTHRWGDRLVLGPDEWRERDVWTAEDYAADTGIEWVLGHLEPGQLYDRTMDITFSVTEWAAMRARIAEAGRQAVTLARVEREPAMPRHENAAGAVAVTEDGKRHDFTVATRTTWCAVCTQHRDDHDGGKGTQIAGTHGFPVWTLPDGLDDEWKARQEDQRLLRVRIASGHDFTPEYRLVNAVADRVYFRLMFPDYDPMPAWLEAAYLKWSEDSVRLAEMRAAEKISAEDFDAIGAVLTRDWWRYHDAQWTAWSERREREALSALRSGGFSGMGIKGGFR